MSILDDLIAKFSPAGRQDRRTGAMWTTPYSWRTTDALYLSRNGSAWLYRVIPGNPMEWEDPTTRLGLAGKLHTLLTELGSSSAAAPVGALRQLSNYREVHLCAISWEEPARPPAGTSEALAEYLNDAFEGFTFPRRELFVGVKLRSSLAGVDVNRGLRGVLDDLRSAAVRALGESVPDLRPFERDADAVSETLARHDARVPTAAELRQLESWYNLGRGPDATIIENKDHIVIDEVDRLEFAVLRRFGQTEFVAPFAQWASEALSHPAAARVISVRAELEPPEVARSRARRSQRRVIADIEEQAASGDLELVEYSDTQHLAKSLEDFFAGSDEPLLTSTSVIFARRVEDVRDTYADYLMSRYRIEVAPLEQRQMFALDECLPGSWRRANPFPQDLSVGMLSQAGLNAFSALGDRRGVLVGVTQTDLAPVFLAPTGPGSASWENRPPLTLICGDPGSGKTFLMQTMALQAALDGTQVILINPKGGDSLADMTELIDGSEVVRMSQLAAQGGAFDPFRYANPSVAAEIAYTYIADVLGPGLSPTQELALGAGLKRGADAGARCVMDALRHVEDADVVTQVVDQIRSSSTFALGVGFVPQDGFSNRNRLTLIEFDHSLNLPDPAKDPAAYTRAERIAIAALRLVTRASVEILVASGGGVLAMDEAWTFLSHPASLAAMQSLGREGRSLGVLPIFATQRIADVLATGRDLETYVSRVFCMAMRDPREATAALTLCGLEPTEARIKFLRQAGPRRAKPGSHGRPALAIHRDLSDAHAAIFIGPVPAHVSIAISTNPEDRRLRDAARTELARGSEAAPAVPPAP